MGNEQVRNSPKITQLRDPLDMQFHFAPTILNILHQLASFSMMMFKNECDIPVARDLAMRKVRKLFGRIEFSCNNYKFNEFCTELP